MLNPRDPKAQEQFRAVALVSQLGFATGMPVVICGLGGYALEQRYPASGLWILGGIGLGLAGGILAAVRIIGPFLFHDDDQE